MKKLLLVGINGVHVNNYLSLVEDYFDSIALITDQVDPHLKVQKSQEVSFSIRNPFKISQSVRKIREMINQFNPDIIHVQQAGTEAWLTLKASSSKPIPIVVTAWGSDILKVPHRGFLYRKMTEFILKKADYLTIDSIYLEGKINKLVPGKDHDVLVANFGVSMVDNDIKKEKIIYSNRLHKDIYRIDTILRAFKKFIAAKEYHDWKLVIAGTGTLSDNLKMLAEELDLGKSVSFVGWLNEKENQAYYSRASIYVSVPSTDATSIGLLEAMAYGCIPALSDLPANREWIEDHQSGIIVKDLEHNYFNKCLQLDQDKAIKINRSIIEKRGTKKVNREKFLSLYNRILAQ